MRTKAKLTPEQFAEAMRDLSDPGDPEVAHGHADDLMCRVLRELGYGDGVAIFEAMTKWYA